MAVLWPARNRPELSQLEVLHAVARQSPSFLNEEGAKDSSLGSRVLASLMPTASGQDRHCCRDNVIGKAMGTWDTVLSVPSETRKGSSISFAVRSLQAP